MISTGHLKTAKAFILLVLFFITLKVVRVLTQTRFQWTQTTPLSQRYYTNSLSHNAEFCLRCWPKKSQSKNHRFGYACIFFLVLFVGDFLLRCSIGFTEKLSLNRGGDYGGRGANSAGTDRKLCLFPTETDISHLLYSTRLLLKPFFWMKEMCTNLERTLLGLTRSFLF